MAASNANLVRQLRQALYTLKKEYGATIDIYKLRTASTDVRTGAQVVDRQVIRVKRAIVLPAKIARTAQAAIALVSQIRGFVTGGGGTYDVGRRDFLIDRADVAKSLPELTADDWIVFAGRKYQVQAIEAFEYDAGWIVTARELAGEVSEQILYARADHLLVFDQGARSG